MWIMYVDYISQRRQCDVIMLFKAAVPSDRDEWWLPAVAETRLDSEGCMESQGQGVHELVLLLEVDA
jgi:hypothetical protein